MSSKVSGNVVALSDYGTRRGGPPHEHVALLNECRDLLAVRLTAFFPELLSRIEDDLYELADVTVEGDLRNQYLDLREQSSRRRVLMTALFRKGFLEACNRRMRREKVAGALDSTAPLSLLDDAELEETIAFAKFAASLRARCDEALFGLGRRLGMLMQVPGLDHADNPLGPDALCAGLTAACRELSIGSDARRTMLRVMEEQLAGKLDRIYGEINDRLVEQGILPVLRPGSGRAARKTFEPDRPETPLPDADSLFATLQRIVAANNATRSGALAAHGGAAVTPLMPGGAPPAAGPGGSPGHAAVAPAGTGVPGAMAGGPGAVAAGGRAMDMLTGLQRGRAGLLVDLDMALDAAAIAGGSVNVLHGIRSSAVGAEIGQVESITVDIVAMLFDYMFDDARIPDPIKALLGRLQIPVLKIALLDKRFFSSRAHPARRLLDAVAAEAVGWNGAADDSDPFYATVRALVRQVTEEFETDTALFTALLARFDAFLDDRDAHERAHADRTTQVVRARERSEAARLLAHEEVERRLAVPAVPEAVRAFVRVHWQDLLRQLHGTMGEVSDPWQDAMDTMDELLWSVTPKTSAEDRHRMVKLLPELLRRLQRGMDTLRLSATAREAFLTALVQCHAQAVKTGLRGDQPAAAGRRPEAPVPAMPAPRSEEDVLELSMEDVVLEGDIPAHMVRRRLQQDGVDLEEVRLEADVRIPGAAVGSAWCEKVKRLRRGAWLEFFREDGPPLRAKLAWISPLKGLYLFTNQQGQKAMAIATDALAVELERGRAEVLSDAPLFDSAVRQILDDLAPGA